MNDERWCDRKRLSGNTVLSRARDHLDAARLRWSVVGAGDEAAERNYDERKTRDTHSDSGLGGAGAGGRGRDENERGDGDERGYRDNRNINVCER